MGKIILAINVSLDGFADHTVAVAADEEMHDFFTGLLEQTEVEVFGRVTYQLMQSYWPHAAEDPGASPSEVRFANRFNAMPKAVFSQTLKAVEWNNTRLDTGTLLEEVTSLRDRATGYVALGGIRTSQQFMKQGLVDEYWLAVHPVIAGSGTRLFPHEGPRLGLKLVDTRTLRSGVAILHYAAQAERD
jgi:dihydrofolate reductase